ncbi:MAG: Ribonuclease E [Holosporales bacterium]
MQRVANKELLLMARQLLIDASHSEELRVAIVKNKVLEEFDSQTTHKKILKGNIYLAKVMRVEPSLQAAFVEYGNGRQGFLPFSEIHPDYYQIPVADRDLILDQHIHAYETEHQEEMLPIDDNESEPSPPVTMAESITQSDEEPSISEKDLIQELEAETEAESESESETEPKKVRRVRGRRTAQKRSDKEDSAKEHAVRPYQYKIQEVIKRRQILLVQVIKEERGNKGAALTTYLSLAGRYCVLMPNAGRRNGGISRKIDDAEDRTRLKETLSSLNVPDGMSLIIRTAGQDKRKNEIKRDYEYLVGVWSRIRDLTLQSIAPALIHEEGDLITRALRDMYDSEIDEILVEGDDAYKRAKNLMKMMIPSHAKRVQHYKNDMLPLFHAYHVEQQIDQVMNPICALPSGGYIVLNSTEALVAIDVNSGKSTRERHIDETAVKTNLEAADEVARQLRLRDLAGLVVIDFIDMHDSKYIQQVERRFKEATKSDRARIQIGRISQFGLLEMSRQRLKPSLMENHSTQCQHCMGAGFVRSIESSALQILRAMEGEAVRGNVQQLLVQVPADVDLYLLNQKRTQLVHIENRFNLKIIIERDTQIMPPLFNIDVIKGSITETVDVAPIVEQVVQPEEKPKKVAKTKKVKERIKVVEKVQDQEEDKNVVEKEEEQPTAPIRKKNNRYNRYKLRRRPDRNQNTEQDGSAPVEKPSIEAVEKPVQEKPEPVPQGEKIQPETGQKNRHKRGKPKKAADAKKNQDEKPATDAKPAPAPIPLEAIPLKNSEPIRSIDPKADLLPEDKKPRKKSKSWLRRLLET